MASSGTPRGGMRPSGRSPPFVIIGLFVVIAILAFNYWSVSSRNSELLREVSDLSMKLRLATQNKLSIEKRAEALLSRMKENEDNLKVVQKESSQKLVENNDLSTQISHLKDEIDKHKQETGTCRDEV
ncbi:protein casc4-like, partial [Lingula anatina]|uniref:Protein casc4-like n=1 Tax=Lingula anatina TaxID=7574 RepID=A0A1S3IHQ9_LINAN